MSEKVKLRFEKLKKIGLDLRHERFREDGKIEATTPKHQVEWLRTYANIIACIPTQHVLSNKPEMMNDMYCDVLFELKSMHNTLPEPYPGSQESFADSDQTGVPIEPTKTRLPSAVGFYSDGLVFTHPETGREWIAEVFTRHPNAPADYTADFPLKQGIQRPPLPTKHGEKWYFTCFPKEVGPKTFDEKLAAYGPFETRHEAIEYCQRLVETGEFDY